MLMAEKKGINCLLFLIGVIGVLGFIYFSIQQKMDIIKHIDRKFGNKNNLSSEPFGNTNFY